MRVIEFNNPADSFVTNVRDINAALKEPTIVLVWASWCPHCVSMKSDWELLKKHVANKANVIEIESSNLDKIKHQRKMLFKSLYSDPQRVQFPMIKMFQDNRGVEYDGERSFATMKKTVNKHYKKTPKSKKTTAHKGGATGGADARQLQNDINNYIKQLVRNLI
jgi:thiol-disulfide isomerase/thioredoxin